MECLTSLPRDAQILSVMTRPSSLEQIKQFMQIDDDTVKANCFGLLLHLLERTFDKNADASGEDCEDEWSVSFAPEKTDEEKASEKELAGTRRTAQEDLFEFMGPIVQLVIAYEISLVN